MNYLKSEHLKFKRTISNKLLFIIPFITAIFAWIVGGFFGFQYTTIYWWYAFLLPGAIAILCSLSHRKEDSAGKYYSVFSMPLNLSKFEMAKGVILIEKLLVNGMGRYIPFAWSMNWVHDVMNSRLCRKWIGGIRSSYL